jgi:DNA-binding winged helix-turn-helix (wHTH) protein
MKSKLLMFALLLASGLLLSAGVMINQEPGSPYSEQRASLLIREIGHQLLLKAGDASSRILSVKHTGDDTFVMKFESAFAFVPDTLVKLTEQKLRSENLALKYMVNVFDCVTDDMVYGFEMRAQDNDIIPCVGRVQPERCYYIQVAFTGVTPGSNTLYHVVFFSLAGIMLVLGYSLRRPGVEKQLPVITFDPVSVGRFDFIKEERILRDGLIRIELSDKETKLLTILSGKINQLIEREELLKEIWIKDGVITGRSLDMFISKLRKKLLGDASVRIVNIHGRGYKLEIQNGQSSHSTGTSTRGGQ